MAYVPQTNSVVAFQSDPTKLVGTFSIVSAGPLSVAGTVGASIVGLPTIQTGNNSVISLYQGSVATVIIGGSIASAGVANQSVSGVVGASIIGYPAVNVGGSVVAFQGGTQITSVVNTVPSSLLVGASIIGLTPVNVSNFPANQSISGQITVVSSLAGGIFPISGSVGAVITNNVTVVSSLAGGIFPISGSVAAVSTNIGSVIALNIGSIISINIGSIITRFADSSILAVPVGSVITLNQGSSILSVPVGSTVTVFQAPSIVGTYAEDAGSATGDKGIFSLGVRNDTLGSLVSADLDYGGFAQDSQGRTIIKPFASEDATIISYVGSTVSGSVQLIQASVIGKKTYVTDFIISNTGSTAALVTLQDGTTSIMGQFIAPAGGGMVATGLNIPLRPVATAGSDLAFKVSPSQSILYLTLKGYQAQ